MAHRGGLPDCCMPFISSGFLKNMTIEQRIQWTEGPSQVEEWNQKVYVTDWPKRSCRTHLSASQAGCCYIGYNKSVNITWIMSTGQHFSSVSRAWSVTGGGGQRMGGPGFPVEGFRFFSFVEMVALWIPWQKSSDENCCCNHGSWNIYQCVSPWCLSMVDWQPETSRTGLAAWIQVKRGIRL